MTVPVAGDVDVFVSVVFCDGSFWVIEPVSVLVVELLLLLFANNSKAINPTTAKARIIAIMINSGFLLLPCFCGNGF